jgi:threonyl-tRNA synthetase
MAENQVQAKSDLFSLRHTCEHVLTTAILRIFGLENITMAMGPAVDNGFYFDFDTNLKLSKDDFPKIEEEMKKVVKENWIIEQVDVEIEVAKNFFENNSYKLDLIDKLAKKETKVSFYLMGKKENLEKNKNLKNKTFEDLFNNDVFVDLCKGPHLKFVKKIKAFKLMSIAGAYWHGDEKNKMLTRIYGTAFSKKEDLENYVQQIEEAKKRDHRKLGRDLKLFTCDDEVGQGLILWLPKGAFVKHKVMEFALNTYLENGYQIVSTPNIASSKLWKHSGHLDFYADSMYESFGIDDEEYRLKPMNCPFHVKIFQSDLRSYKELPIRYTEMGTVYRYERSGTLHGLTRVRGFTQDDAHIICTPDQLDDEINRALELTKYILTYFGFKDLEVNLSIRDQKKKDKFIGSDEEWEQAQNALIKALKKAGFADYVTDEGGAVFYGPKIDVKVSDSLNRKWQLSTIQVDFNLPGRFKMEYVDKDGKKKVPFMIHRALLGSLERFMGVYIEHTAGAFPFWLSFIQIKILPITDEQNKYAQEIQDLLKKNGFRVEVNDKSEPLNAKIKDAQIQKIPYMMVLGKKEVENGEATIRSRDNKKQEVVSKNDLIKFFQNKL